jgi:hypothetical protein
MMRDAQVIITWPSSGEVEFDTFRVIPSLHGTVIDSRPALVIRDSAILHEVFGLNHPRFADCRFPSADGSNDIMLVDTVRYIGPPPT